MYRNEKKKKKEIILSMIFIFVEFYKYVECFNIMNYVIFFISHKKNNSNKIFFQIKNKIYL